LEALSTINKSESQKFKWKMWMEKRWGQLFEWLPSIG